MEYPIIKGDLIVGTSDPDVAVYTPAGAKATAHPAILAGDPQQVAELQRAMSKNALSHGGTAVGSADNSTTGHTAPKKTRNRRKELVPTYGDLPLVSPKAQPVEKMTVQFENNFGKLKIKVTKVLEHSRAFALFFENEEDMVFEPKVGETLIFFDQHRQKHDVYYPGVAFDSTNNDEKIMILFRTEE